jgi:hypothetical protein
VAKESPNGIELQKTKTNMHTGSEGVGNKRVASLRFIDGRNGSEICDLLLLADILSMQNLGKSLSSATYLE